MPGSGTLHPLQDNIDCAINGGSEFIVDSAADSKAMQRLRKRQDISRDNFMTLCLALFQVSNGLSWEKGYECIGGTRESRSRIQNAHIVSG
jgi:hypothetical protein